MLPKVHSLPFFLQCNHNIPRVNTPCGFDVVTDAMPSSCIFVFAMLIRLYKERIFPHVVVLHVNQKNPLEDLCIVYTRHFSTSDSNFSFTNFLGREKTITVNDSLIKFTRIARNLLTSNVLGS